jgi:hypothetical protein
VTIGRHPQLSQAQDSRNNKEDRPHLNSARKVTTPYPGTVIERPALGPRSSLVSLR